MSTSAAGIYSSLVSDPDLGELVAMFVAEMPDKIENLLRLYDDGDRGELTRAAHQMKGAAGSYGFHDITPHAARLELSLKSDRPEEQIKQELDALLDLCHRVRAGAPS